MPSATLLLSPVVSRRTSYQEVVHRECRPLGPHPPSITCPVTRLASRLAEWLVVLQKVAEDRGPELPSASCRCEKATRLCEEIQSLGRRVAEAGQLAERVGGQLPPGMLEGLGADIAKVAHTLRSEVSILVPSGVGAAEPEVAEAARWLLSDGDLRTVMSSTAEELATTVSGLLGVEECVHHDEASPMELEDIDEDIRSMVASMCGDSGEGRVGGASPGGREASRPREVGKQILERSRKRKQSRPTRDEDYQYKNRGGEELQSASLTASGSLVPPVSPVKRLKRVMTSLGTSYSLPSSAPEASGDQGDKVISLLEKKKKLVKKDGLYKFVLWKEALRDEKTKMDL